MSSQKKEKKISVSIAAKPNSSPPFEQFLVRSTEDALYIDFAEKHERKDVIEVIVKESIAISADEMLRFTYEILQELVSYEKRYHNGKGLPIPNDSPEKE